MSTLDDAFDLQRSLRPHRPLMANLDDIDLRLKRSDP